MISQIYGGGGNAGATLRNDFIELFNASATSVSVDGWSVQYASAAGSTWQVTALSGSVPPGQYYLVQEARGNGGTVDLPAPNAVGTVPMSATTGKVALASSATALSGACPTGGSIVDFVGYGTGSGGASCFEGTAATPTLSNTTAALRLGNGTQDTDNNSSDFMTGTPNPRNSGGTGSNPSATASATPTSVTAGGTALLTVAVTPGTAPTSTGIIVTGDLSSIGGPSTQSFFDDATNGDATAGDNTFSFTATVISSTVAGTKTLPVLISDAQGRTGNTTISLTVTAPPLELAIHDIQGTGTVSPFAQRLVSTTGIVTGATRNGFFIQAPADAVDADINTPEGIFVFTSSVPPATAAVGNLVQVTGTVAEFVPSTDPNSPPSTEISGSPSVVLLSTNNSLPGAITLTAANTDAAGPIDQLQKYKAMRVHVDTLNVIAPTAGNVGEANATATSNGTFFGVLPGIARPFREPGIQLPDPLPAGAPANVPRFDANPERVRVVTGVLTGSTRLDVTTGATVTDLTGPLDFADRTYTILNEPGLGKATGNISAIPVPAPLASELTIASFNMERFFDTTDDPNISDVALTVTAFANRLNKASLAIRNVLQMPDVIGVEEMENLATLQALADKVNADAAAANQPQPNYHAYLIEGNDVGGIDVGFLVKDRVTVIDVQQVGKDTTFVQPDGTTALLNDRPALVLKATAARTGSDVSLPVTIVVNHLRSLLSVDDPVDGPRVRAKREAQAEFVANLLQQHQAAGENVVSLCDCNAFEFNDGFVDVMGTIYGTPTTPDQVVNAGPDLVAPDFTDLVTALPHDQQYSFVFQGSAQTLDHVVVNGPMISRLTRFAYARNNADFPEIYRSDPDRPERTSDHDMPVAYFNLPEPSAPVLHLPANLMVEAIGPNGSNVTFSASATDAVDGTDPVTCSPASGSLFVLGTTTVGCSATNQRGSTATGTFTVAVVDTTAPVVTVKGVIHGATYFLGLVPKATCSSTDTVSGISRAAMVTVTGGNANGAGQFTATCSGAIDRAGNEAPPVTATYRVEYVFVGFLPPLRLIGLPGGEFNAGTTVPIQWQLWSLSLRSFTNLDAVRSLKIAANTSCVIGGEGPEFGPAGSLRIVDRSTYQFNWRTAGLSRGCYSIVLSLDDGTTKKSVVRLR